jgi:antitoxin MazE
MRVAVKKWGNSASVRIPAAIMATAGVSLDDIVDIHEENGRIIIEPVQPHIYHLQQLLNGITADNRHDAVDFGPAVGKEVL